MLEIITLRDDATGSEAKILPGYGFNCYSFRPRIDGEAIETLWAAPNFESGTERASHSGIPLLFPFPGRIGGGVMSFGGKTYHVTDGDRDDGRGNAIHGFVLNRPWQVVACDQTRVVAEFQASRVDPKLLELWPADYKLTVSYQLRGTALVSRILIENPDTKPLPFGLGTHPYFRVPLGARGERDACRVTVPVGKVWPLENMLPSGKTEPAVGRYALAGGLPFAATQFDDVFSGLTLDGNQYVSEIVDPGSGRRLRMTFDKSFMAAVVYNPPHREAICIEPYTCIPDYARLSGLGIDAGMRVLAPGQSAVYDVTIELR